MIQNIFYSPLFWQRSKQFGWPESRLYFDFLIGTKDFYPQSIHNLKKMYIKVQRATDCSFPIVGFKNVQSIN